MTSAREPVTGGVDHFPIYDRHGTRLHVGDRLRAQCCVGRYGQTRTIETTITRAHWPYCCLNAEGCVVTTQFDHSARVLRCYYRHHDVEHAHEAWAEVINP